MEEWTEDFEFKYSNSVGETTIVGLHVEDDANLDKMGELITRFLKAVGYTYVSGVQFIKEDI